MVRSRIYWLFSLLLGFVSCETSEVGKVYQGWKEGEVDIHHIYTGRGESSFLIFPDDVEFTLEVEEKLKTYSLTSEFDIVIGLSSGKAIVIEEKRANTE